MLIHIDKKESFVNTISKYFQLEYEFIVGIILVKSSKTKILGFRSRDPSICDVLQQIYRISKSDSISLIMTRINGILKMFFFINIPICKIQYSIKLKGKPGYTTKTYFLKQAVGFSDVFIKNSVSMIFEADVIKLISCLYIFGNA